MCVCVCTCVYICTDTHEGVLKIVSMVIYLQNSVHIYAYKYYVLCIYISHRGKFPSNCPFTIQPLSNWSFIHLLLSCRVHEIKDGNLCIDFGKHG